MAKKKNQKKKKNEMHGHIEGAGIVRDEHVTDTLKSNYMPYAMSVILSRAIPEIDGFKPSHRKILYTMHKMNLHGNTRTKSANVVGQVMKLNPHGDATIYETMVRLSRGNETLLYPFVDSKGNFGKSYSKGMEHAASRYTEVKLEGIAKELFMDIEKNTVDFAPNYDNTTTEPVLLPVTFPTILVNSNIGIAVGMASAIPSFNLKEVCDTTIALLKNRDHNIMKTLKAPDFPGAGVLIYEKETIKQIYETGRGGVRIRGKADYDEDAGCIDITQIPPSTTIEAIIDRVIKLSKEGRFTEITDIRDETDLSGLKVTVDLKKGADAKIVIEKLFQMTPLEDTFSCNFNLLVDGYPRVMGIREILTSWTKFRLECIARRLAFDIEKQSEKLHLLKGLEKILLDIDKVIRLVRETKEDKKVIPNLMKGFEIDENQANYVAEIKIRNLNEEFIIKRISEIKDLEKSIADMRETLADDKKRENLIIEELTEVSLKYGDKRKTLILDAEEVAQIDIVEETPDYPVHLFFTKEGYFKKTTPQSLRMTEKVMLKDGDEVLQQIDGENSSEILFFTNLHQVYKTAAHEFDDTRAGDLGDYLPAQLDMDRDEIPVFMVVTTDYSGHLVFIYENGKIARVPLDAYETKTNRKRLLNAYTDKLELVKILHVSEKTDIAVSNTNSRLLIFSSEDVPERKARDNQGVFIMKIKKNHKIIHAFIYEKDGVKNKTRFSPKTIPSAGGIIRDDDLLGIKKEELI